MARIHSLILTSAVFGALAGLACEKKKGDASDMVPPGSASAAIAPAPSSGARPKASSQPIISPIGDAGPARRPADAGPEDNVSAACPGGAVCDWACSAGKCTQICAKDSECKATCAGGTCTQACAEGAKCDFSCSGGKCKQTCTDATGCKKTCTGKGCT